MNQIRVHHLNFFKPEPKAIHSLAYDEGCARLAVSRTDSSIEIWDLGHKPYMEKVILGQPENSVECLAWYKGRLFSAGLQGKIVEYDLTTLCAKDVTLVTVGCCIWCMSLHKKKALLAAGTEDGHVSIYKVSDYGLDFVKILAKQEGRILSLAWHESGKILVTGSTDTIRIYNVDSGRVVDRIMIGRSQKHVETIVWCLAITSDMTIISGDSRGRTSFWDGNTGTLLSSATHKADVLALCLSKDEKTVYTSGIDPVIIMYCKTQSRERSNVWVKSVQRNIHTHDVRALQLSGEFLISGGVDTKLVLSKFPPKTVISFCPFSHVSYSSVARGETCALLKYPKHLEVWQLGSSLVHSDVDGEHLPLSTMPINLVKLRCRSDSIITCSTISSDGQWVAYSTLSHLVLFHVTLGNNSTMETPILRRIKPLPVKDAGFARCLLFTSSSNLLILTADGQLQILECNKDAPRLKATFDQDNFSLSGRIHLMTLSLNDQYVALGTHDGHISIFDLGESKVHCSLPSYKCQPTAMEFDIDCEHLIVAYSDRKIVEFSLSEKRYSNWCQKQNFEDFQHCSFYPIREISFIYNSKRHFLVHDENSFYVFDKSKSIESKPESKRPKISEATSLRRNCSSQNSDKNYRRVEKSEHLLDVKALHGDELLMVEVRPAYIQEKLPPALLRKRYGI